MVLTPAGFEQMFQEGGTPAHDPTTPPTEDYDAQQVIRLSAKYGMDIIGPPLS
ncbi:MAG TPA: hypothetical protein VJS86_18560 [Arthrobacter sp.]|nr:hypothetical protein [Arthrobacter sp.]